MKKPAHCPKRVGLVAVAITVLLTSSTLCAEEGPNTNKLKVGTLLTLEGEDAAGGLYEANLWVSGRAFLPFTRGKRFYVFEFLDDDSMWLARWGPHGDFFSYQNGSEVAVFINGPVGTTFQYDDPDGTVQGTVVSVGETVVVPAGTFHNCVQVEKHDLSGSPLWIEWWKPGLFIVKWTDWWVPEPAPVEWELVSIEHTRP